MMAEYWVEWMVGLLAVKWELLWAEWLVASMVVMMVAQKVG
jgi:hypothetical protein